ncbi:FAD-dependent oxidoreductase [Streptomyces sp. NPDC006283]|uniref:NAD(P)/FAD-dependent oxidoreductase n=1 Tax=Streptomyces sp. NPDC006283 TaxID=3156741 RepID=UPI0033A80E67
MNGDGSLERFKREGRIVVVGASLAGLRAAETLRDRGFSGSLTMIGDEPYEPYDRPPLSKQVLLGGAGADRTALPRRRALDATWRLGVPATGLDMAARRVRLADGDEVPYDRLLIATGVRARPWPREDEAELDGVFVLRTRDDGAALARRLAEGPKRVFVIGAGFTGSEIASACRERGLPVTVAERADQGRRGTQLNNRGYLLRIFKDVSSGLNVLSDDGLDVDTAEPIPRQLEPEDSRFDQVAAGSVDRETRGRRIKRHTDDVGVVVEGDLLLSVLLDYLLLRAEDARADVDVFSGRSG